MIGTTSQQSDRVRGEDESVGGIRQLAETQTQRGAVPTRGPQLRTLELDLKWMRLQNFITPQDDRTLIAEGFRRVKRQILANMAKSEAGAPANLIMVTSSLPREGKTFCSINLAISIAMELDRRVLLVDADTVQPAILPTLGLKPGLQGLMDVLSDPSIQVEDVLHRTNIEKLTIIPAGTAHRHATEILASETMRTLLRELSERYEDRIVIFDSPPLLVTSEAAVLATHMSQIVMVVAAGQTTEAALKDALRRLEGCGRVGLLLNKGRPPQSPYYGYGGYG
ncbi:MAG: XrtA-associated tyrosine autokinase [Betaproteobacteria bacterium]